MKEVPRWISPIRGREVASISGVTAVDIRLGSGILSIDSQARSDGEAIKGAVEAVGYPLAG